MDDQSKSKHLELQYQIHVHMITRCSLKSIPHHQENAILLLLHSSLFLADLRSQLAFS
jgi:hypothetical protein